MARSESAGTNPWERTLREVESMAARLRADGWEVVVVRAGHVAPVAPEVDVTDREGLVYVAPDGVAGDLPSIVERGEFDRYETFRRQVGSDLFLLTRLTDPRARLAVLLAGAIDMQKARPLIEAARERGVLHSHVRLLDGTQLASFRHEDPDHFFPA